MKLIGFVLLLPTVLIVAMGVDAGSGGAPIAFGLWMFFGLPTMVGAIFMFKKDRPVVQYAVVETEQPPRDANVKMMAAMELAIEADAKNKMIAATEHTIEGMPKKPTAPVFGKCSA
ncbi:hypothetical protein CQ12_41345 [Bradyrhizobium jicamae]|uniref:Uncharacterized protein n=1 Tax=Bradyrhizobium jicamae TaxID=280332 RepID=A0A0R3LN13_9BRAD|nr:hypothetical protein [Bradyrhizobium jicamae]KRR06803.1 hypothetical protein CQ12_41345 [Bradyrhizobium jicamae]